MEKRDPLKEVANTSNNDAQESTDEAPKPPDPIPTTSSTDSDNKENGFSHKTQKTDADSSGCGSSKSKETKPRRSILKAFDPLYKDSPEKVVSITSNKSEERLRPQLVIEDSDDSFQAQSSQSVDVSDDDDDTTYVDASTATDVSIRANLDPENKPLEQEKSLLKFDTPEKVFVAHKDSDTEVPSTSAVVESQTVLENVEIPTSTTDQSNVQTETSRPEITESEIVSAISRKLSSDCDIIPTRSKFTITESELENYNVLRERFSIENRDQLLRARQESAADPIQTNSLTSVSEIRNISPERSNAGIEVEDYDEPLASTSADQDHSLSTVESVEKEESSDDSQESKITVIEKRAAVQFAAAKREDQALPGSSGEQPAPEPKDTVSSDSSNSVEYTPQSDSDNISRVHVRDIIKKCQTVLDLLPDQQFSETSIEQSDLSFHVSESYSQEQSERELDTELNTRSDFDEKQSEKQESCKDELEAQSEDIPKKPQAEEKSDAHSEPEEEQVEQQDSSKNKLEGQSEGNIQKEPQTEEKSDVPSELEEKLEQAGSSKNELEGQSENNLQKEPQAEERFETSSQPEEKVEQPDSAKNELEGQSEGNIQQESQTEASKQQESQTEATVEQESQTEGNVEQESQTEATVHQESQTEEDLHEEPQSEHDQLKSEDKETETQDLAAEGTSKDCDEESQKVVSDSEVDSHAQKSEDISKEKSESESGVVSTTAVASTSAPSGAEAATSTEEETSETKTEETEDKASETEKASDANSAVESDSTGYIHQDDRHLDSGVDSIEDSDVKSSKSPVNIDDSDKGEERELPVEKQDSASDEKSTPTEADPKEISSGEKVDEDCKTVTAVSNIQDDEQAKVLDDSAERKVEEEAKLISEPIEPEIKKAVIALPENQKKSDIKITDFDTLKAKMADLSEKLSEQQQENSDLKLQLNAIQQAKASLELEIRQKEEVIIKTQAEALKNEQTFKQEIKQLREKLKENSKLIEKDSSKELEEQLKEAKAKEAKVVAELNQRTKDDLNYQKIMEEYENTIASQFADFQKLKEEHETATRHLANLELAFSDVHQKYERSKTIIEGFKANEEAQNAALEAFEKTGKQHEERYESLKAHAKGQIEKSNKEILLLRNKYEMDVNKLKAIIKRLEIKCSSLEVSLQMKNEECAALSALCDEVTGKKV